MNEREKQIYRLGQLYGYICEKHRHWESVVHDSQAAATPMKGFTVAFLTAVKAKAIKPDDMYIMLRVDTLDPEFPQDKISSLDEQGIFTLGKMQRKRTVKSLIDHTGLTQAEIAKIVGVTPLTVGRWYRAETPLPETARFKLEGILLDK